MKIINSSIALPFTANENNILHVNGIVFAKILVPILVFIN